jgi:hypothetical protein
MALFNREKRVDDRPVAREREIVDERPADRHSERPAERRRYARGVTRGLFTLVGAAAAVFLAWLAAEVFTLGDSSTDFWIAMGLIAGAGLALGLSQLFGGWTKWGVPRISSGVFLFGWIPTAVVTGWILMTMQPAGGWQQGRLEDWSDSIGVLGFVNNFEGWLTAIPALLIGLVTAFIFDTTGPRLKTDTIDRERRVPDEDVHDYRGEDEGVTTVTRRDEPATRREEPVAAGTTTSTERPAETTTSTRRETR